MASLEDRSCYIVILQYPKSGLIIPIQGGRVPAPHYAPACSAAGYTTAQRYEVWLAAATYLPAGAATSAAMGSWPKSTSRILNPGVLP